MRISDVRVELMRHGYSGEAIDRMQVYHNLNPAVWKGFESCAKKLLAEGKRKIGAKLIAERLRWFREHDSAIMHAVNNNFTAMYARIFVAKYPQYRDRFELRATAGLRQGVQTSLELRCN